ncbi:MAG: hypothetical protein IIZ78_25770 [Clostridiales bacterium]|nr:hypothetical protein [Clostridiales bacterium]
MGKPTKDIKFLKKLESPSSREINTSLIMLRAFQQGLSLDDMGVLEIGELTDIFIESGNDNYDYPKKATESDFKAMFGG